MKTAASVYKLAIFFWCSVLLCTAVPVGAEILLPTDAGEVRIQSCIYLLKDSGGALTIEDMDRPEVVSRFVLNSEGETGYGYSDAVYWIRFTLTQEALDHRQWFVQHHYPHLDRIDFFAPEPSGRYDRIETGDTFSFEKRPVQTRRFMFPVSPGPHGTTYYMRLSSSGAMNFRLSLMEKEAFYRSSLHSQMAAGLYFGALLIMVAYNLLFLVAVRERLYLYYAGHVLCIGLHQIIWFGYGFEYLWPGTPGLNNVLDIFSGSALFFFLGLFTMEFLRTRDHMPRIHKALKSLTLASGAGALLVFVLDRSLLLAPTNYINIAMILTVFMASLQGLRLRLRPAYILVLAWSIALAGALSQSLYKAGLLPEIEILSLSVQAGILCNVLLISMGLADRINAMKNSLAISKQRIENQHTELKSACSRLETSEKRFRDLADLLPLTVFEVDIDGTFIYANRQGMALTGYSMSDFKAGINAMSFFSDEDHQRLQHDMAMVLSTHAVHQAEYAIRRKDGSRVSVYIYASVIYEDGQPAGIRGAAMDLTERKKTEALMIQTEKMMSVGGLAAGMAHEINNPLAGMIQGAQVVYNRLTKDLPANVRAAEEIGTSMDMIRAYAEKRGITDQIEAIRKSGARVAKIIDNMLSFSKKGDMEKQACQLDVLIDDTIDLLQKDYELKSKYSFDRIDIQREYPKDLPEVQCEPSKIQQVIFNLAKNAAQAMNESPVQGRIPSIAFSLRQEFNMVCIDVADNGPGMTEEVKKKIFEPFFTTKGFKKGTGLGLSVSYFIIVDDHKGQMQVVSSPGKGSRFIVKIPIGHG